MIQSTDVLESQYNKGWLYLGTGLNVHWSWDDFCRNSALSDQSWQYLQRSTLWMSGQQQVNFLVNGKKNKLLWVKCENRNLMSDLPSFSCVFPHKRKGDTREATAYLQQLFPPFNRMVVKVCSIQIYLSFLAKFFRNIKYRKFCNSHQPKLSPLLPWEHYSPCLHEHYFLLCCKRLS